MSTDNIFNSLSNKKNVKLLFACLFILIFTTNCSQGDLCIKSELDDLTIDQKNEAIFYIDADVVYRNDEYEFEMFESSNEDDLLCVRMTQPGKYVKEGSSTTFVWMKDGKRIMLGDPRNGGSYVEVDCHTIELEYENDIHLIFESVSKENYTLKTVLYQGVDVENKKNEKGIKYSPVFYMMDVDLRIDLAKN